METYYLRHKDQQRSIHRRRDGRYYLLKGKQDGLMIFEHRRNAEAFRQMFFIHNDLEIIRENEYADLEQDYI